MIHHLEDNSISVERNFRLPVGKGWFYYDVRCGRKIIEYNGDFWHANPKIYQEHELIKFPGNTMMYAYELWVRDQTRTQVARDHGFDLLTVWESDFRSNKEEILNQCLNFMIQ